MTAAQPGRPRRVIVESPYRTPDPAAFLRHIAYARAALRDCLARGEAPFASHLLYTQPQVMHARATWFDDGDNALRQVGIDAGLAWGSVGELCAVYGDLGVTLGMMQGVAAAETAGLPIDWRSLQDWAGAAGAPAALCGECAKCRDHTCSEDGATVGTADDCRLDLARGWRPRPMHGGAYT
ncbi:MAG: hypothetical protein WDN25_29975 [Acetobacteraceae bacterium]